VKFEKDYTVNPCQNSGQNCVIQNGSTTPAAQLSINGASGANAFLIGSTSSTTLIVDPYGQIGIGTNNPGQYLSGPQNNQILTIQKEDTSANQFRAMLQMVSFGNGSSAAPEFFLRHSRGNSNSPLPTANADRLGGIYFAGNTETGTAASFNNTAAINALATQNFSSGVSGTALTFSTTPNDGFIRQERLRIDHNGNIGVATTTPAWLLQLASSTTQLAVTNMSGPTNGKHWLFTALADGRFQIGTSSDLLNASTSLLTFGTNGAPTFT
jgi:hypothetical protein